MVSQLRIRAISLDNALEVGRVIKLLRDVYPNPRVYRRLIEGESTLDSKGESSAKVSSSGNIQQGFSSIAIFYLGEPVAHIALVIDHEAKFANVLFAAYNKELESFRPELNFLVWQKLVSLGQRQSWLEIGFSDSDPAHVLRQFSFREFQEKVVQILPYDSLEESIVTIVENEDVMMSQLGLGPVAEKRNSFKNAGESGG